jgi:hypothetical protein
LLFQIYPYERMRVVTFLAFKDSLARGSAPSTG